MTQRSSKQLHSRLTRTPDEHVATRRELAVAYARMCPCSTAAWAHLASALVDLCLFKEASVALKRLERVAGAEELGEVLVRTGQLTEAQLYLRRAVRRESKDPSSAYYQLGLIARARRRYADAVRHFDAAIQHDSKYRLARVARRDVRAAMKLLRTGSRAASSGLR